MIDVESIARTLARGKHPVRLSDGSWLTLCPAHPDRNPSLSLKLAGDTLLWHCFAGCSQESVQRALQRLGLLEKRKPDKLGPIVAEYIYVDIDNNPVLRVTRHIPKDFRMWQPNRNGGWTPGLNGWKPDIVYRLPEVLRSPAVIVTEGEKDVESLRSHGFVATCNPGGAGKWTQAHARWLAGKHVIIIPDSDPPGWAHANKIAATLRGLARQLILIDLRPDGVKDISEWFEQGHSEVELANLIDSAWRD